VAAVGRCHSGRLGGLLAAVHFETDAPTGRGFRGGLVDDFSLVDDQNTVAEVE
jgi:hypothetical protein